MWDARATAAAVGAIGGIVRQRMQRRVDANDQPYPRGTDLVESGRLRKSFAEEVRGDAGALVNTAPYAGPVNARTPFMGVGRQIVDVDAEVERQLRRIEASL